MRGVTCPPAKAPTRTGAILPAAVRTENTPCRYYIPRGIRVQCWSGVQINGVEWSRAQCQNKMLESMLQGV